MKANNQILMKSVLNMRKELKINSPECAGKYFIYKIHANQQFFNTNQFLWSR